MLHAPKVNAFIYAAGIDTESCKQFVVKVIGSRTWVAWLIAIRQGLILENGVLVGCPRLLQVLVSPQLHPSKEEKLNCKKGAIVNPIVKFAGIEPGQEF